MICLHKIGLALVLSISVAFAPPSQEIPQITKQAKALFDIQKPIIIKDYKIFIAKTKLDSNKPLRVLFILDGNAQFPIALNEYAKIKNSKHPLLIVGVGYDGNLAYNIPRRTRDYLPDKNPNENLNALNEKSAKNSGAQAFYEILRTEIFPLIFKKYSIDSNHIGLFGHSFGGIFGLYAALYHQDFSHYFIASPSLWHQEMQIPKTNCNGKIYITQGALEPYKGGVKLQDFVNELQKVCVISFKSFENQTHGGNVATSVAMALEVMLDN